MILRRQDRVLIHGITGERATFWGERMRSYGTTVIGGVDPFAAGETHLDRPVWGSAIEAADDLLAIDDRIDIAVLFNGPLEVKAAALDAIEAGIGKLIVLSDHVPAQDAMYVLAAAEDAEVQVLGPSSLGVATPGEAFAGTLPAFDEKMFKPGTVGVVSRAGSLGALVCRNLVQSGLGISSFIGLGGDPINGTTIGDALRLFEQDDRTVAVVLLGEIGGTQEEDAADYAAVMKKPVAAFIAGSAVPSERRIGHAGAIVLGDRGSHASKKTALEKAGVAVLPTPSGVARSLAGRL